MSAKNRKAHTDLHTTYISSLPLDLRVLNVKPIRTRETRNVSTVKLLYSCGSIVFMRKCNISYCFIFYYSAFPDSSEWLEHVFNSILIAISTVKLPHEQAAII